MTQLVNDHSALAEAVSDAILLTEARSEWSRDKSVRDLFGNFQSFWGAKRALIAFAAGKAPAAPTLPADADPLAPSAPPATPAEAAYTAAEKAGHVRRYSRREGPDAETQEANREGRAAVRKAYRATTTASYGG